MSLIYPDHATRYLNSLRCLALDKFVTRHDHSFIAVSLGAAFFGTPNDFDVVLCNLRRRRPDRIHRCVARSRPLHRRLHYWRDGGKPRSVAENRSTARRDGRALDGCNGVRVETPSAQRANYIHAHLAADHYLWSYLRNHPCGAVETRIARRDRRNIRRCNRGLAVVQTQTESILFRRIRALIVPHLAAYGARTRHVTIRQWS